MDENTALTVAQVAERFGVNVPTVRRWIKRKQLNAARPGGKTWIILERDVQAMLDAGDPGFAGFTPNGDLWQSPGGLETAAEPAPKTDMWDDPDGAPALSSNGDS
jgi:excisionase family DNA binding protein